MARESTKDDHLDTESLVGVAVSGECMRALKELEQLVLGGVKHGHFKCTVVCEMTNGRKRRLVIEAGKSHQYLIPPEEVENVDV